jgi:DNA-binding NarL/FixJ family response regulator
MGRRAARRQTAAMTPSHPPRVYFVEDSPLVLERLERMATLAGAHCVGHAAGAVEAVRGILAAHPDLVFLDLNLAQGTGIDVLRSLRQEAPLTDVYMLSNFAEPAYRQLAERLGARGFFDKTTEIGRVVDLIAARAAALH